MRSGFVPKRCPKCGGNVYVDRDLYGWYEQCLQCGNCSDLKDIVEVREKVGNGCEEEVKWKKEQEVTTQEI